jgi:serine/alanine adding enzyme
MTMHARLTLPERDLTRDALVTEFIDPINDARWDRFVRNHPFGWLTHLSSWKKVLESSFSHMKGYYPALVDPYSSEIRAALPVFEVKSWLTGRRMVSIPWATLSDPLVTCREEFALLSAEVQELSKRLGAGHVEIRTLHTTSLVQDGRVQERPHYIHHYLNLDSNLDLDDLMKSFHRTCVQQRIRRAQSRNIALRIGDSEEDLRILYAFHLKNRRKNSLPPQPYLFFKNIWETLLPEQRISLLIAEHDGQPIAVLLLFKFKDRMSAEVAHMDDNYRNLSPNIFLFWEAILQAVREGYKLFDFGRTAPTNHPLLAFKSRWGTHVSDITTFYYPQKISSKLSVENSFRYKMMKKICKFAPESVMPHFGRFCYRHSG